MSESREPEIPGYTVLEQIGKGGFGEVYRATHDLIGREVAIKVLHAKHSADPAAATRFLIEARAVAKLSHPNIVDLFEFGVLPGGRQYCIMEFLRGQTLREILRARGKLPLDEARPILEGIAAAVDAAHEAGVVHRDLKPDNVFVVDGGVKLIDFGLAKLGGDEQSPTETGSIFGTPVYMSPEQCRGKEVGPAADAYGFGVVAYHMLVGRPPFEGDSLELALHHLNDEPPRPSQLEPSLPESVDRALLSLLTKDPERRPVSLLAALAGTAPPRRSPRSRMRWGALAVVLLASGVVGSISWWSRRAQTDTGVAVTTLEPSQSVSPDARRLFHEAMTAFRLGQADQARGKLEQAVAHEPEFAAAYLQLVVIRYYQQMPGSREAYLRASELRPLLDERDRALLAAIEGCVVPEVADYAKCQADAAHARDEFPLDAELWGLSGGVAGNLGKFDESERFITRALELDPQFAAFAAIGAQGQAYTGRFDEARRTVTSCLAVNPNSASCLDLELWLGEQLGDRHEFTRAAKQLWLAHETGSEEVTAFADSLYVAGSARSAVLEALSRYWNTMPGGPQSWTARRDRAALQLLDGDFAGALAELSAIEEAAIASDDPWRWTRTVIMRLDALEETGQISAAAAHAQTLRQRIPVLQANSNVEDWGIAEAPLPPLAGFEARGGAISAAEHAQLLDGWVDEWSKLARTFKPFVWLHGYAATASTIDEARAALARQATFGPVPPFRPLTATNYSLGHVALLAGRDDEAVRYLELAVKSSAAIEYPLAFVRAHLDLGKVLVRRGDRIGACRELAEVLVHWGAARPSSTTGAEASSLSRELGCMP